MAEEHLNRDTGVELHECWVAALKRQEGIELIEEVWHPLMDVVWTPVTVNDVGYYQELHVPIYVAFHPEEDWSITVKMSAGFLFMLEAGT